MKTRFCRYCGGTTRITLRSKGGMPHTHACTSCNGTGIDGDPRGALVAMVVSGLAFVGGLIWWLV